MLCHRYLSQSKPHVPKMPSTVPSGNLLPITRISASAEGRPGRCPVLCLTCFLEGPSVGPGITICSGITHPFSVFSHFANLGLPTGPWPPFPFSWHHYYEAKAFVNLHHFFMKLWIRAITSLMTKRPHCRENEENLHPGLRAVWLLQRFISAGSYMSTAAPRPR